MDDNLDLYDTVARRKEFRWVYPGKERRQFDSFSRRYTVAVQSLDPAFYNDAMVIMERDYTQFDIMCGNLKISQKPKATRCLMDITRLRIEEGLSLACLELETQKLVGVLVAVIRQRERGRYVVPDIPSNMEADKDIIFMEKVRCKLFSQAYEKIVRYHWGEGPFLEIKAICGSREATDNLYAEFRLMSAIIEAARTLKLCSIMAITSYKKHQQAMLTLGFIKLSELAYGTINREYNDKIFWNVGASPTIMCLYYRLDTGRRRYGERGGDLILPPKPRPQHFTFAFH